MNPKRIILALALALLASGASTWFVFRRMTKPVPSRPPEVRYVAASRAVEAGEVLSAADIEVVAWPANLPIDGVLSRAGDAIGREVLYPLGRGQPVLDRDLSVAGAGTGLASKIPDGMRAVALRSDEVVGVAGFLVPGSHLDVLVTYRSESSPEVLTATAIENVVVIAVGHQIEPDPKTKTPDATVVTLLLTPEQSERAVLASSQGAIHFVLRNAHDATRSREMPVLLSQLAARPLPAAQAPARPTAARASVPVPAAPKRTEIETVTQ